jgi:hypothetical protein
VYCIPVPCESLEESSAKTLFLLGILECRKDNGVYFALDTAKSKVLSKLKSVNIIGKAVWDQRGDIRDVISIGKLVRKNDGPEEVKQILNTTTKYGRK